MPKVQLIDDIIYEDNRVSRKDFSPGIGRYRQVKGKFYDRNSLPYY